MNNEDRLQLLQALDAKQQRRQHSARMTALAAVVTASLITCALVVFAYFEVSKLTRQASELKRTIAQQTSDSNKLDQELIEKRKELAATEQLLQQRNQLINNLPKASVEDAAAKLKSPPPRIYLQIVRLDDRNHANQVARELEKVGFVVPGVEYVRDAAKQTHTEVRYYKATDESQAESIVQLLRRLGDQSAVGKYLKQYESSTKVRPGHYEVWFAPQG